MESPRRAFSFDEYNVTHKVRADQDGMRLDSFVQEFFPSFSREMVKKKIATGDVKIKNRPHGHRPSTRVHIKEEIHIRISRGLLEDEYWHGERIELNLNPPIIYEDENLLVISKPPFMSTHPTGRHLFYCATVLMQEKTQQEIYSCHRLDRETSGVLILAKNSKWANFVSTAFEDTINQKAYFFIANKNKINSYPFEARENLGKDESTFDETLERLIMRTYPEGSELGKVSRTIFDKIFETEKFLLGLAFPKTGRQHQIRSHAAHHGLPLLGDKIYHGGIDVFLRFKDALATEEDYEKIQIPRQALHAFALELPHLKDLPSPFFAPIPEDLTQWLETELKINVKDLEEKLKYKVTERFKMERKLSKNES